MRSTHSKNVKKIEDTPIFSHTISDRNTEMENVMAMMERLLQWAAIIESSDDAIISKSIDGTITSWNVGAERLYGYTAKEIVGKPVSVLMPPEKVDDFPFIMNQLRAGKRIDHYETKRKAKDGRILSVSITVSPIKDINGKIIGASKIARDISMRIENERRREEFVSTASHELKTPITTQKAYGQLLERMLIKDGDTKYIPYVNKINQQTLKLTKLIEDLLELSRFQNGTLQMDISTFDYGTLLTEIAEDLQNIIPQKISVKCMAQVDVEGDRERIGQVLNNLITNASKYSPKTDKIDISCVLKDGFVITSVKDYGIGIGKDHLTKIFERFYRVTGDDEKTYPGMGIGLTFSKEVVERHDGTIWAESEKGKGSIFSFSLPVTK